MSGTNIQALEPMKCVFISKTKTESEIFKLHYNFTTKILMVISALTIINTISTSIVCYSTDRGLPEDVLNAYCSMQNTFIMKAALGKRIGEDIPHSGLDTHVPGSNDEDRIYQRYYIWVPMFFVIQAAMFFTPHYLWRQVRPNKINYLLLSLHRPIVVVVEEGLEQLDKFVKKRREELAKYLKKTWGSHSAYFIGYVVCAGLSLINVIGQIFYVDHVLDGEFSDYGSQVFGFWLGSREMANRSDPMTRIFPRMTKCTYHQFGTGGSVQRHDIICVLPFNIYYEKIFIALWIWYIVLAILTAIDFIYQMLTLACPPFRNWVILRSLPKDTPSIKDDNGDEDEHETLPLTLMKFPPSVPIRHPSRAPNGHPSVSAEPEDNVEQYPTEKYSYKVMQHILGKANAGDWFMLQLLQKNISGNHFEKVMPILYNYLREEPED